MYYFIKNFSRAKSCNKKGIPKCTTFKSTVTNHSCVKRLLFYYYYYYFFGHTITCGYFLGAPVSLQNFFTCCLLTPSGKIKEEVITVL